MRLTFELMWLSKILIRDGYLMLEEVAAFLPWSVCELAFPSYQQVGFSKGLKLPGHFN